MNQIERIMYMERILDEAAAAVSELQHALDQYTSILPALEELTAYYTGGQWMEDYHDDEAGRIPADLKRGVLSEDAVWNLLTDNRQLQESLRHFKTDIKNGGNTMKKNFGPQTWIYPMPVFIIGTYNEDGTPNAMNAAWGGTANSNQISICVDRVHKTTENFLARKAFTVAIADAANVVPSDYVGIVSGFDAPDKISRAGLTPAASQFVDAPLFEEYRMTLECRLVSYNEETELLIGEIVNVCADESVLAEDGQIDIMKLQPITFDPVHNGYHVIGEKVGQAFSDGSALE